MALAVDVIDRLGLYLSEESNTYLQSKKINHELSAPYSPAQNGVTERFNRTLMESVRSKMAQAGPSKHYWAGSSSNCHSIKELLTNKVSEKQNTL